MSEITKKIIHNINSDIASLDQALEIIGENMRTDLELSEKMVGLSQEKIKKIKKEWEEVKVIINGVL